MSFGKTYHRISIFSMVNSFDLHLLDIPIDHILPFFALVIPGQQSLLHKYAFPLKRRFHIFSQVTIDIRIFEPFVL